MDNHRGCCPLFYLVVYVVGKIGVEVLYFHCTTVREGAFRGIKRVKLILIDNNAGSYKTWAAVETKTFKVY